MPPCVHPDRAAEFHAHDTKENTVHLSLDVLVDTPITRRTAKKLTRKAARVTYRGDIAEQLDEIEQDRVETERMARIEAMRSMEYRDLVWSDQRPGSHEPELLAVYYEILDEHERGFEAAGLSDYGCGSHCEVCFDDYDAELMAEQAESDLWRRIDAEDRERGEAPAQPEHDPFGTGIDRTVGGFW